MGRLIALVTITHAVHVFIQPVDLSDFTGDTKALWRLLDARAASNGYAVAIVQEGQSCACLGFRSGALVRKGGDGEEGGNGCEWVWAKM